MWDVIEFIAGIFDLFTAWRFYVCLLVSFALVGLVYWLIPNRSLCLSLSIPIAVVGICTGAVWQWRNR